jgi:hypothetical protein
MTLTRVKQGLSSRAAETVGSGRQAGIDATGRDGLPQLLQH